VAASGFCLRWAVCSEYKEAMLLVLMPLTELMVYSLKVVGTGVISNESATCRVIALFASYRPESR
jgi:hypothetical protein